MPSPHAVFATRPHLECCILSYSTHNGALTSMYGLQLSGHTQAPMSQFEYNRVNNECMQLLADTSVT